MIHLHKWVSDTQGAIYCIKCRKFKGWMPGKIVVTHDSIWKGSVGYQGWGYLLNGMGWKKQKEHEIKENGGFYR